MKYGYYDDINKEYVITRPDTPTPWINYLNNGKYCALISNTAGGYSFYIDPKKMRILRYRYNNLPIDRPGRYIYIKDISLQENKPFWSITWQPTLGDYDKYECRHGMGYTKISMKQHDIQSSVCYFVPISDDIELWVVSITNSSNEKKTLQVYSYAEFCIQDAAKDQRDLQYIQNIAVGQYEKPIQAIVYNEFEQYSPFTFFYVNQILESYDCDREKFIGKYHSEADPIAIKNGGCKNSQALGGNPIAATQIRIELEPNETKTFYYILGICNKKDDIQPIIQKYGNVGSVNHELEQLRDKWQNYLQKMTVQTPDPKFNTMINIWNPYQCKMTFDWARYASYYETGLGRGIGFRDCHQDMMAVCHLVPELVRNRIIELTHTQFENGSVYHKYFPLSKQGDFPDYVNPLMKFFADDHLWMIYSVTKYVKETGDLSILKEILPYVEGGTDSIYEHLKKAIHFTNTHLGPHGFPLVGTADWNDCFQLHGPNKEGESVMVAMQYVKACNELSQLASYLNKSKDVSQMQEYAIKMKQSINEKAWDGEWYLRGFADDGSPIGAKKNPEAKIFLNTQSWAVMSGVATPQRAKQCMDAVRSHLVTIYGIKLFNPPYSKPNRLVNGLAGFPPGLKENGSIFCHTNPWAEIAECLLQRGNNAYEYYLKIAPTMKNDIAEIHETEPYVYSQMITGNDHPQFGKAKNSWLTGTASWTLQAATDYFLGIRVEFEGIVVNPCIPNSWDLFTVNRKFRGATYKIQVRNPNNLSTGIQEVLIDDEIYTKKMPLPIFPIGETHTVKITMGQ